MENQPRSLRSTTDLSRTEWPSLTLNSRRRERQNSGPRNVSFENMNNDNSNNDPSGTGAPPADNAPAAADTAPDAAPPVAEQPARAERGTDTEGLAAASYKLRLHLVLQKVSILHCQQQ